MHSRATRLHLGAHPAPHLRVLGHPLPQQQRHRGPKQPVAVAGSRKLLRQLSRLLLLPGTAAFPGVATAAQGRLRRRCRCVALHQGCEAPASQRVPPNGRLLCLPCRPACARHHTRGSLPRLPKQQQHRRAKPLLCRCHGSCWGRCFSATCSAVEAGAQAAQPLLLPTQHESEGPSRGGGGVCSDASLLWRQRHLCQRPVGRQRQA